MPNLPKRILGRTGLPVTTLGFGALELRGMVAGVGRPLTPGQPERILNAVLDAGINYIDVAVDYGEAEAHIGRCIASRRQEFFREEFLAAVEILVRGDISPDRLKGSWAGAFGPTQFMPTSFKRYAVDFDGDGRRDIVDSIPDLLASTANNLKKDGWASGQTWGYEVLLPRGFNYLLADRARSMTSAPAPRMAAMQMSLMSTGAWRSPRSSWSWRVS